MTAHFTLPTQRIPGQVGQRKGNVQRKTLSCVVDTADHKSNPSLVKEVGKCTIHEGKGFQKEKEHDLVHSTLPLRMTRTGELHLDGRKAAETSTDSGEI